MALDKSSFFLRRGFSRRGHRGQLKFRILFRWKSTPSIEKRCSHKVYLMQNSSWFVLIESPFHESVFFFMFQIPPSVASCRCNHRRQDVRLSGVFALEWILPIEKSIQDFSGCKRTQKRKGSIIHSVRRHKNETVCSNWAVLVGTVRCRFDRAGIQSPVECIVWSAECSQLWRSATWSALQCSAKRIKISDAKSKGRANA